MLLLIVTGVSAVNFYGIYALLRVLYVLRLGFGPEYLGIFSAAGALTYMSMGIPSGALGGRYGVRKIMLIGGVITIVGMFVMPLAEFFPMWVQRVWLLLSQIILIGGWSLFNVNLVPAIKATTSSENINKTYALSSALRSLGTFLGTVIGGMLPGLFARLLDQSVDAPISYRWSLWSGVTLTLASVILVTLVHPAPPATGGPSTRTYGRFPLWPVLLFSLYIFLSQSGWATCQAFCSAYLDEDLHLSVSANGWVTGIGQLVAIGVSLLMPRLAARQREGWSLIMAMLGMAASLASLALFFHWFPASLGRIGVAAMWAVWLPAVQVFQMELVAERWRALAYGIISMVMGLAFGSVSLAGGYVIAAHGYRILFLAGMGLNLAAALAIWLILKTQLMTRPSKA